MYIPPHPVKQATEQMYIPTHPLKHPTEQNCIPQHRMKQPTEQMYIPSYPGKQLTERKKYIYTLISLSHLSLNHEGRWGTTDDFATSFLHFSLFSTALWDLPNSRPVHSLMLSSHLFICLPCLLPPFTVPSKMVLARPDEQETCAYHFSLHLFMMVRRSSCSPISAALHI